jgi:hypothetical protein
MQILLFEADGPTRPANGSDTRMSQRLSNPHLDEGGPFICLHQGASRRLNELRNIGTELIGVND